jgi:hypothetical protein
LDDEEDGMRKGKCGIFSKQTGNNWEFFKWKTIVFYEV